VQRAKGQRAKGKENESWCFYSLRFALCYFPLALSLCALPFAPSPLALSLCVLPFAPSPLALSHEIRHSRVDNFWHSFRARWRGFIESHQLRLPARATSAGTSVALVTGVAFKRLRDGRGNGGSADRSKTERSDRQSNNKAEGNEATGAASFPLVIFPASTQAANRPGLNQINETLQPCRVRIGLHQMVFNWFFTCLNSYVKWLCKLIHFSRDRQCILSSVARVTHRSTLK